MRTLQEQRKAILQSQVDLERELNKNSKKYDQELVDEILERIEALLDAAETLTRVQSMVEFVSDVWHPD